MFDNVSYKYDEKTQVYTFSSNFGINFRGFIMNSIVGRKKFDLLFRNLSFKEIVIDSFFLLELNEICKYILNGEAPYTSWVNLKAIKALQKVLMEETWLNPKEYDFHGAFKLNMDLLDKVMDVKPLEFQNQAFIEYEFFKNVLGYNGILLDAATGTGKSFLSLALSIALESEIVIMAVMNVSIDATWKKALLRENFFNKDYQPTESDIYTSADYYSGKPYTGQKYVIFNYEAINKLNLFIGKFKYRKITVIVDEVHNFTADSKRKNDLLELAIQTKSKDIILLSGTPVKSSTLELIPYLELIDPKFTPVVKNRFQKIYGSPNNILKRCTPIRYGMMSTRIEKAELNLEPVEYKTITVTLPDGDLYTLKHIKEEMIKYIDVRSKEIEDNLWKYKNVYTQLLEKVKFGSNLPAMTWIEYQNDFELVCEYYIKRQLMFHGDLIKRVNDFEKTIIIASLQGDEKKQFKEAAVILKYPMLKIRGEVLGIIVLGNRIKCHKEMAKVLDYSILDSTVAKGIVMTSYVEIADAVVEKLKKQKYIPATIYGDNTKQSARTISEFIDNEAINPLVGTYKSISTGLHLVVANMIILLDLPFRTYMLDQAIARVHRMGQERQVIVLYTVLDTGEEYNINSRNIDILKWSKDAIEEITGHMVKGLDFEKGKALDLGIDDVGLEGEYPTWVWEDGLENGYTPDINNYNIFYPWSGLENDNSLKDIYIDVKNLYRETEINKLYTW